MKSLTHEGHPLLANPLSIGSHLQEVPEWQRQVLAALALRDITIPYSSYRQIQEAEDKAAIPLSAKQYYSLIRRLRLSDGNSDTLEQLLIWIREQGFRQDLPIGEVANEVR